MVNVPLEIDHQPSLDIEKYIITQKKKFKKTTTIYLKYLYNINRYLNTPSYFISIVFLDHITSGSIPYL